MAELLLALRGLLWRPDTQPVPWPPAHSNKGAAEAADLHHTGAGQQQIAADYFRGRQADRQAGRWEEEGHWSASQQASLRGGAEAGRQAGRLSY